MKTWTIAPFPNATSLVMTSTANHGCGFNISLSYLDYKPCFSTMILSNYWTTEQPAARVEILTQCPTCSMDNSIGTSSTHSSALMARHLIANISKTSTTLPSVYLSMAFPFSTRGTFPHGP